VAKTVRPIRIVRDYVKRGEGSCLFQMGDTRVLCVASVENHLPPHAEEKQIGWVSAEYGMLPRAGDKRTQRNRASGSGRSREISRIVGRSLRAVVDLPALHPHSIIVDCDVIQADGGTRTASINGGYIALADALRYLRRKGELSSWPLKDHLAAVSVGIRDGRLLLDLKAEDDVDADVDLNVVMTGSGKYVEIQGTAEGEAFDERQLRSLLSLARTGIRQIVRKQKRILKTLVPSD